MAEASDFYGKKLGTEVSVEQIKTELGANSARVAKPNSPLTLDLRHDRITIYVNDDDEIEVILWG